MTAELTSATLAAMGNVEGAIIVTGLSLVWAVAYCGYAIMKRLDALERRTAGELEYTPREPRKLTPAEEAKRARREAKWQAKIARQEHEEYARRVLSGEISARDREC